MPRTIRGMWKSHWVRRIVLALVWAYAAATWASIGHYFVGLPDLGPVLIIGVAALIMLWPHSARDDNRKVSSVAFRTAVKHSR
jgi:hypothetical protein